MADVAVTAAKVAVVYPTKAECYDGIAAVTITAGQILYRVVATGKLGLADEDASAEASQAVGVALNGGGAGSAISYCKRGHVAGFTCGAYGLPLSLSATAGALLDTAATTNVVGRVEALSDSDLTKVIYFDFPIGTYATVAT